MYNFVFIYEHIFVFLWGRGELAFDHEPAFGAKTIPILFA